MTKAIYPGTFDPLTLGHLDIVQRASQLFDHVTILLAVNSKKAPLFELAQRQELIEACIKDFDNVSVTPFEGLMVNYARECGATAVIRGLRAVSDFDYEAQMALVNSRMAPEIETVFLLASEHHVFISSSIVRELYRFSNEYKQFVPTPVIRAMEERKRSNTESDPQP